MSKIHETILDRAELKRHFKTSAWHLKIPFVLRKEFDETIDEATQLLSDMNTMFWTDSDFISDIQLFLVKSEQIIKNLHAELEQPQLAELLEFVQHQNVLCNNFIDEEISSSRKTKAQASSKQLLLFYETQNKQEYN